MTTMEPLLVRLLTSPAEGTPDWDVQRLVEAVARLGHEVRAVPVTPGDVHDDPDGAAVVHAFGWDAARAAAGAADTTGTAWVFTPVTAAPSHGVIDLRDNDELGSLARSADAVAVSTTDQERHVNQLGVSRARTHVLPLGIDADLFSRSGPAANRTGRFRIVCEALRASDGVLDAVAALEALPDAELMVLIPVPRTDIDTVPHLVAVRDAAEHAGVRDRVAFYTPGEDRERAWLLRSADAVVSVPLVPGAHRIVLEAMSCGRPVVSTPVGGARDLVVHGVTGLHVTSGDGRALLGALRQLQSEPFTVEAMGSAGADRVLSRYAWDRAAAEFAGLWARCAASSGAEVAPTPVDATA